MTNLTAEEASKKVGEIVFKECERCGTRGYAVVNAPSFLSWNNTENKKNYWISKFDPVGENELCFVCKKELKKVAYDKKLDILPNTL